MYDKNIIIRTRVTRQMRDEFKEACEANNTSMSDLLRMWVADYVATNKPIDDVATNNKDDVATLIGRNKVGQVVATAKIKLSKGDDVATYNKNQPIAKKYYVATKDNIELADGVNIVAT